MKGGAVLIIDDDPMFRRTLTWLLEANCFNIEVATSAVQAYKISSQRFDVIIVDLMLPQLNGLAIIRWVRGRSGSTDVPIIAVSAHERNYPVAAISAGANKALHTPDDLDRILEVAETLLRPVARAVHHSGVYRRAS